MNNEKNVKKKRNKKYDDEQLVKKLIDKELEPFGVTMEDVRGIENWYNQYEVSEEQNQAWIDWSVDFMVKHAKNPMLRTKKRAKKEMLWVNLQWGLKIDQNYGKRRLLLEKIKSDEEKFI